MAAADAAFSVQAMTDANNSFELERILKPYTPDPNTRGRKLLRRVGFAFLFFFCWFWGLAFAFLAPYLMLFFAFPIAALLALCIWALPEEQAPPLKALNWLFFAYLVGKIAWPDYLAIDTHVLPWITISRLIGFPLALAFLVSLSVSRSFRSRLADVSRSSKAIVTLLLAFNVLQVALLPLSKSLAFSVDRIYNDEVSWILMFFSAAYLLIEPGRVEKWVRMFWMLTIPITLIAIAEFFKGHVLWAGHIPGFLKIEDPAIDAMLHGGMRAYTGRYRTLSTYTTPLGLAEYLALAAPFALHTLMSREYPARLRLIAGITVPFIMFGVWLTNARLGSIGFLAGAGLYGLVWALKQRRFNPRNVFASLITYSYPALFLAVMAATVAIGRLRRIVWGGGETAASTEGRKDQLRAALPIIGRNPIGHGPGMAAQTLGFREPSGLLTIDSYFLSIVLEYGVIGFLIYYGMFAWGAGRAIRTGMTTPPEKRELSLLIPAGVSLVVYILIKSVFSEEGNNSLAFIILGLVCALLYRSQTEAATASLPAEAGLDSASPSKRRGVRAHRPVANGGGPRRPTRPAIQPANP